MSDFTSICHFIRYDSTTGQYEKCRKRNCRYAHTLSQIRVHPREQCRDRLKHAILKWDCTLYHHFREAPYHYFVRVHGLPFPLPHHNLALTYAYADEVENWPFYHPQRDREYISPCPALTAQQPCRDPDCQYAHKTEELNIPNRRYCSEKGCEGCSRYHPEKETVEAYFRRHQFLTNEW